MATSNKPASKPVKHSKQPPPHPLDVLRRARDEHGIRRILVGCSCGKDSTATISLCREFFDEVQCFFMFFVADLSFQESYLRYVERRFKLPPIIRVPHWSLSYIFQDAAFRHPTAAKKTKLVKIRDVEEYLRQRTGISWFASGEKAIDSVERNARIRKCSGIDTTSRKIFPLAYWNHAAVFNYLKMQQIALPTDYNNPDFSGSFGALWYRELRHIRDKYPDDWTKILKVFPLLPAQMLRGDLKREREAGVNG